MAKPRFSEEQIAFTQRQADSEAPVADVRRQLRLSEATSCTWKKKYGSLRGSALRQPYYIGDA